MEQTYRERNAAVLARLRALIERLSDEALAHALEDGWTVSIALAHIAFWDRYQTARWAEAVRQQLPVPVEIDDAGDDWVNTASLESWRAMPPRLAAAQALAAATQIERVIAALPPEVAAALLAAGRITLVDRTAHWLEHIEQIETALGH